MTAADVLAVVEARGLAVVLDAGRMVLRGPADGKTPELIEVLALHREEIMEEVAARAAAPAPPRLREWLTVGGFVAREERDWCSVGDPAQNPAAAHWWRWQGERDWHLLPGRNPAAIPNIRE